MSRIEELGESILAAQANLGLQNPRWFAPGTKDLDGQWKDSLTIPDKCEIRELFAWRNGSSEAAARMGELWLIPGFYMLSAQEAFLSNRYCTKNLEAWAGTWVPILTNGAAGMRFCDLGQSSNGRLPVFDYDLENVPIVSQIYDSIQSMLATMMACYEQGVYFVGSMGYLESDFAAEVELSRGLNASSDYWNHTDL